MYLLFTENHTHTDTPAIGDGSFLKLVLCNEGWYVPSEFKSMIDGLGWDYTEVDSITLPTWIVTGKQ